MNDKKVGIRRFWALVLACVWGSGINSGCGKGGEPGVTTGDAVPTSASASSLSAPAGADFFVEVAAAGQPAAGYALHGGEAGVPLEVFVRTERPVGASGPAKLALSLGVAGSGQLLDEPASSRADGGRDIVAFAVPAGVVETDGAFGMAFHAVWPGSPGGAPARVERYMDAGVAGLFDGNSTDPANWTLVDIDGYRQHREDARSRIVISLDQPMDGKLTLVVEDAAGNRVRNLLGGEAREAGRLEELWDGLDDAGNLVAEGEYRWRAVHHPGIVPEYLMAYNNGGEDMLRPFGTNHGTFTSAASDGRFVYLGAPITEGGWAMIAMDAEGNWRRGYAEIHGTGYNAVALASDGNFLYSIHEGPVPNQEQPRGAFDRSRDIEMRYGFNITRYDIETAKVVSYEGGRNFLWLDFAYTRTRRQAAGMRGAALVDGKLYIASHYTNEILVVEPDSGAIASRLAIKSPGPLADGGERTLLAAGERTVAAINLSSGENRTVLRDIDCQGLFYERTEKRLFVSDGERHTVRSFRGPDMREEREYGLPGGPYKGTYDPQRLVNPAGLAVRGGRLWITEADRRNPKRAGMWDVATGELLREKFGNPPYGGDGAGVDHVNPSRFIGLRCEWEIDIENRTETCLAILQGPEPGVSADAMATQRGRGHFGGYYGQAYRYRYHHQDGRRFLIGAGFISVVGEFMPDGSLRDIAAMSNVGSFRYGCGWHPPASFERALRKHLDANGIPYTEEELHNPHHRAIPALGGRFGDIGVLWRDANGDGLCDEDEFTFSPPGITMGGTRWGHVGQGLEMQEPIFREGGQGILRLKPVRTADGGFPAYPALDQAVESTVWVERPDGLGTFRRLGVPSVTDRFGRTIFNSDGNMVGFNPDGRMEWFYPNQWVDVHGSHNAPLPRVGEMQGNLFFLGIAPLDDQADVFVLNGNHGRFFILSSDGMYLDEMFRDVRMGGPLDELHVGGEPFGGFFARAETHGEYYVITGANGYRIYRLHGLDRITRSGGTVSVDAAQLMAAERRLARQLAEATERKLAAALEMKKPPVVDADARDWGAGDWIAWGEPGGARARIAYDRNNLYLFYQVEDTSPWVNRGGDWQSLFKTGDSVDLQIAANSAAAANRGKPVDGDVRLLIAPHGDENIAVLYRHRLADKTDANPVTFTSPWRGETVDDVRRIESAVIAVRRESGRYRVEASIPLADLGLSYEAVHNRALRADLGFILSDSGGTVNLRRAYWANQATGLVNDVPGEIMLNPSLWGELAFGAAVSETPAPVAPSVDATATSDTRAALRWVGVLGNSGEHGGHLAKGASGSHREQGRAAALGVVYDQHGALWAAGGRGLLNRYALDGRMLSSHPMPLRDPSHLDRMALVGERIAILLGGRLYVLDTAAPDDAAVEDTGIDADWMSLDSHGGRVAITRGRRSLLWFDPRQRSTAEVAAFPEAMDNMEPVVDGDGNVFVRTRAGAFEVADGGFVDMQRFPNEAGSRRSDVVAGMLQFVDGHWYAHAWHGTIFRYDRDFNPDPGVVYGGASGSFIGRVDSNQELSHGRSIVKVGDNLFATSGANAVVMILEWDPVERKLKTVRRIGPFINDFGGLAFDGRSVWVRNGVWSWFDGPTAPLRLGATMVPDGQLVVRDNLGVSGPCVRYGSRPGWVKGNLDDVLGVVEHSQRNVFRLGNSGTALYMDGGERRALVINRKGELIEYAVDGNWAPTENLGVVPINPQSPVTVWTSLAHRDGRLYAGADGAVRVFETRDGAWVETDGIDGWGESEKRTFGGEVHFCLDGADLWLSDTTKHRVLLFNLDGWRFVAEIGVVGEPGSGSGRFNGPEAISARGGRAVLVDAGNSRLVKIERH